MDINLKEERTGFDIIQEILKENPGEKIVVLTSYDLDHYKEKAFKLGIKDYLNKSMEVEKLVESLIKVPSGKTIYKKQFLLDPLTERELEVLQELVTGDSKKSDCQKTIY